MLFVVLLAVFAIVTIKSGKLTPLAALAACVTGALVYIGTGYKGISLLGLFFLLGTLATAHRKSEKSKGEHPQQRTAGQVFANGGVAAIMGGAAFMLPPYKELLLLLAAASLASATADTLSSELGVIYGKRFYNILTFRRDAKGLNGVVSLEGTLLGAAGSFFLAAIYGVITGHEDYIWIVGVAGVAGNLADSLLGATLERKNILGNNAVNFLNTAAAALLAFILFYQTF
jgi:uncharacterized protein (TIGR00297 family)